MPTYWPHANGLSSSPKSPNSVKGQKVVAFFFRICRQTDRQTDKPVGAVRGISTPLRPRNQYDRDGKFRTTFKSGTEKRQFSVPLSMTWCSQNAPNCTDLHPYFQNFPEVTPPDPKTGKGVSPSPDFSPSTRAHRRNFSRLPRPLPLRCPL